MQKLHGDSTPASAHEYGIDRTLRALRDYPEMRSVNAVSHSIRTCIGSASKIGDYACAREVAALVEVIRAPIKGVYSPINGQNLAYEAFNRTFYSQTGTCADTNIIAVFFCGNRAIAEPKKWTPNHFALVASDDVSKLKSNSSQECHLVLSSADENSFSLPKTSTDEDADTPVDDVPAARKDNDDAATANFTADSEPYSDRFLPSWEGQHGYICNAYKHLD